MFTRDIFIAMRTSSLANSHITYVINERRPDAQNRERERISKKQKTKHNKHVKKLYILLSGITRIEEKNTHHVLKHVTTTKPDRRRRRRFFHSTEPSLEDEKEWKR